MADHGAAEGVAQVVEAEVLTQVHFSQRRAVALLQGPVADVLAARRAEDEIVLGGEVVTLAETRQPFGDSSAIGTARSVPPFVVVSPWVQFSRT